MTEQCGMVSPLWVALGLVQWHGHPERERQYTIDYRRCPSTETARVTKWGSVAHLCWEHAALAAPDGGVER